MLASILSAARVYTCAHCMLQLNLHVHLQTPFVHACMRVHACISPHGLKTLTHFTASLCLHGPLREGGANPPGAQLTVTGEHGELCLRHRRPRGVVHGICHAALAPRAGLLAVGK